MWYAVWNTPYSTVVGYRVWIVFTLWNSWSLFGCIRFIISWKGLWLALYSLWTLLTIILGKPYGTYLQGSSLIVCFPLSANRICDIYNALLFSSADLIFHFYILLLQGFMYLMNVSNIDVTLSWNISLIGSLFQIHLVTISVGGA